MAHLIAFLWMAISSGGCALEVPVHFCLNGSCLPMKIWSLGFVLHQWVVSCGRSRGVENLWMVVGWWGWGRSMCVCVGG